MKRFTKFICLIVVFSLFMALPVAAEEVAPYASNFFMYHDVYLWETSSTSFQIWYDVTAVGTMAELGVDYIDLERSTNGTNWSVVKTYDHDDYSGLVARNTSSHSGYVTYSNRQSGYQYRAYIRLYAKNNSGSVGYNGVYAYF